MESDVISAGAEAIAGAQGGGGTQPAVGGSMVACQIDPKIYEVPCAGCTRCCHGDAVRLLPGDDPSRYQTEPHPYVSSARMLAHKPNGDCVYLAGGGCTIQATKPRMCREMDCRRLAEVISWTAARKLESQGRLPMGVWRRGKDLLRMG